MENDMFHFGKISSIVNIVYFIGTNWFRKRSEKEKRNNLQWKNEFHSENSVVGVCYITKKFLFFSVQMCVYIRNSIYLRCSLCVCVRCVCAAAHEVKCKITILWMRKLHNWSFWIFQLPVHRIRVDLQLNGCEQI